MPPNQGAFNRAYGSLTRRNRVNRMLQNKKKPGLTRQEGSRNLIKKYGLKTFGFSNNTKKNNQNTRGFSRHRAWPNGLEVNRPALKIQANRIMNELTQEKFNAMDPIEKEVIESVSRFSGPGSVNYVRPYFKGNFGPKEAKMMANLTAQYNNPEDMMVAVEQLNLSNNMKRKFMLNIASMYR
jgi:hypothetical protein